MGLVGSDFEEINDGRGRADDELVPWLGPGLASMGTPPPESSTETGPPEDYDG